MGVMIRTPELDPRAVKLMLARTGDSLPKNPDRRVAPFRPLIRSACQSISAGGTLSVAVRPTPSLV